MLRKIQYVWLSVAATILLCVGCGGGNSVNDNPPDAAVFISVFVDDNGDFIEAEMIKEITTTTAIATVRAGSNFSGIATSVGTIRLERYEVTFVREDGGMPNVGMVTGLIDATLAAPGTAGLANVPTSAGFEFDVFTTFEKAFSQFAQAFAATPLVPVTFQANLKVFGRNLAGDAVMATGGFKVQAAVFLPIDSLLPVIASLDESGSNISNINVGDDYFATWSTFNRVDEGVFILPWGTVLFLDASFFPFGGLIANTSFLEDVIPDGETRTFPSGVLIASNPFGSVRQVASDFSPATIRITNPQDPPPSPVTISEFFSDRTIILLGESVNLNWATSGGVTQLQILPDTYNGEVVDFSGKDPAFDSVNITPDFSIRPILRAIRGSDGVFGEKFLAESITVNQPVDPNQPVDIVFFQASSTNVPENQQVIFFWEVTGGVEKIELFPINIGRVDVTDRNTYLSPPLVGQGQKRFSLVAFGQDGSIDKQDVLVNVVDSNNQQIRILNVRQAPAFSINNNDQGSFSFTISDPERQDSSWRVNLVAGDQASFFPRDGKVEDGLGDAAVSFNDGPENGNGFLVFEISAYDDDNFGFTRDATRAVQLVTYPTTGAISDTAPTISTASFVPAGDPSGVPGSEGIITFEFSDPDTLNLTWSVSIIAGDFGGTFSRGSGSVSTGAGEIEVRYTDDVDTPTDPVIFLIRVSEALTGNPQSDIVVLRVDKGSINPVTPDDSGDTPDGFLFETLLDNFFGDADEGNKIEDFTLYFNGDLANPIFYKNADLTGELIGISAIFDYQAEDPSILKNVNFNRDFIEPTTSANTGSLSFVGYYGGPGALGSSSRTPISGGVSRWYMPITAESFRAGDGEPYNLPASGTRLYEIAVQGGNETEVLGSVTRTLRVIVP